MNCRKTCTFLIIFVVITMAILSNARVEASRVLSEDFAGANRLVDMHSTTYEKAKQTVASWLERLPSGPSDRGAGH
ncbi:hypothetical protein I3843_02G087700 [Carya illinoinensis]|nr:hypothetical protein I3760_02G102900 [Carya illinoinensis]KAG7991648.1 hypothetical protein I3843_02G087700 [Carya illinoinensis]